MIRLAYRKAACRHAAQMAGLPPGNARDSVRKCESIKRGKGPGDAAVARRSSRAKDRRAPLLLMGGGRLVGDSALHAGDRRRLRRGHSMGMDGGRVGGLAVTDLLVALG